MSFIIILFLSMSLPIKYVVCDCKQVKDLPKAQRLSYDHHNLVFFGRVTELNSDRTYKFEILEIFKGNELEFVSGYVNTSCDVAPLNDEEFWLVYTQEPNEDGFITISMCGFSRSFKHPFINGWVDIPPPPPGEPVPQIDHEIMYSSYRTKQLEILKAEIEQLRKWRDK